MEPTNIKKNVMNIMKSSSDKHYITDSAPYHFKQTGAKFLSKNQRSE
jgi:hypothetical protein